MPSLRFDELEGDVQEAPKAPRFDDLKDDSENKMGAAKAALLGAGQGATLGFGDELIGAYQALMRPRQVKLGKGFEPEAGDTPEEAAFKAQALKEQAGRKSVYEAARDAVRSENDKARKDRAGAYLTGEIGASVLLPVPGAGAAKAAGLGARAASSGLRGAGLGAVYGLGSSDAALSRGDIAGAAIDTGLGAGLGFVGGAASEGLSDVGKYVLNKARGRAQAGVRSAIADAGQAASLKARKEVNKAASGLGGRSSSARNSLDVMKEIVRNPNATPEQKAAAQSILNSPEAVDLERGVYDNILELFPGQTASLKTGREVLGTAQKGATQEAIESATDEALSKPTEPIKRFVRNYASRTIPPAVGGYLGNQIDDNGFVGTGLGLLGGGVVGAAIGDPGRALTNVIRNPAVRKAFWGVVSKGLNPGLAQKFAPLLEKAALGGENKLAATTLVLSRKYPESLPLLERMADTLKGGEWAAAEEELAQR